MSLRILIPEGLCSDHETDHKTYCLNVYTCTVPAGAVTRSRHDNGVDRIAQNILSADLSRKARNALKNLHIGMHIECIEHRGGIFCHIAPLLNFAAVTPPIRVLLRV